MRVIWKWNSVFFWHLLCDLSLSSSFSWFSLGSFAYDWLLHHLLDKRIKDQTKYWSKHLSNRWHNRTFKPTYTYLCFSMIDFQPSQTMWTKNTMVLVSFDTQKLLIVIIEEQGNNLFVFGQQQWNNLS